MDPAKANGSPRRHLGGDDWITRFAAPSQWTLRIDAGHPKHGWRARRPATSTSPAFPGTAIEFEDALWEVLEERVTHKQPPRYCYFLAPWPSNETPRAVLAYSAAIAEDHREALSEASAHARRSAGALLLSPILALLPADDQLRLERELDHPAVRATLITAAVEAASSAAGLIFSVWAMGSPDAGPLARDLAPWVRLLAAWGLLEGFLRLASAALQDQPMGSFPVVFPVLVFRALHRALDRARHGDAQTPRGPAYGVRAITDRRFLGARDEIRDLPPADPESGHRLEVLSLLPKPHWTLNRTGVRIGGHWYVPVERQELSDDEGAGGPPRRRDHRHRFVLERTQGETYFAQHVDYRPDEVQELWLEQQRRSASTRVETLRQLWGLLEPDDQARLETVYGYDARRNTRASIYLFGSLAAVALFVAWANFSAGRASILLDGTVVVVSLVVIADAVRRWRQRHGETVPGSWLAPLVRPLARPLLQIPTLEEWRRLSVDGGAT